MTNRSAVGELAKWHTLLPAVVLALGGCAAKPPVESSLVSEAGPPVAWTSEAWPEEAAAEYALNRDDFERRDQRLFESDLGSAGETASQLGLSDFPAPVQPYDTYEGVENCLAASLPHFDRVKVGDQVLRVQGRTIAYASPFVLPREVGYKVKFNLFYITDVSDLGNSTVSSRNCPNYMATGGVPTSQGAIEWLQMTMLDGRSLAVINHRVFDLEFGRTILAVPMQDGSIRLRQIQSSIDVMSVEDIEGAGNPDGTHRGFMRSLLSDPEVLAFLTQDGAMKSVLNERLDQFLDQIK